VTALADAPVLFGCQEPRIKSVPPFTASLGDRAVAFAAKAGLHLDPWQQMVLRDSMGVASGGKWSAPQVGLLCPRQNGKGSILEALELFHMFALGTKLIVHSAHKFDTSQEHFLRMRDLIEGNPDLDKHVDAMPTANGKEAIILTNGNRLKFKARTVGGGGRGFSSDLLILDEAMLLPEKALKAMLPTLRARKNPQVWFTSSAGDVDSDALWRIVKMGRSGAKRLAYFEWGCESGVDVLDVENWAKANPGLGYRLTVEGLEDDLGLLSEESFAVEHLGIWDDAATGGVFVPGSWEAIADAASKIVGTPMFAVDVSPDRVSASIGAAGGRIDGRLQLETVENRPGTDWIVPEMTRISLEHGGSVVIDPASPAGTLVGDLERAGVRVHTVSARDYAVACGRLYDAVKNAEVRHLGDGLLDAAVRDARTRDLAGGIAWDRKKSSADITPLVSVTLAYWGFQSFGGDPSGQIW
jgi:phage terminase large subunit-like protein